MKRTIFFALLVMFSVAAYGQAQTLYVVSQYYEKNVETGEDAGYHPSANILELDVTAKTAKWGGQKFNLGAVKKTGSSTYYPLLFSSQGTDVHSMTLKITGNDMISFVPGTKESAGTKYKLGTKEEYNKARANSGSGVGEGFNKAINSVGNLFKSKDKKENKEEKK